MQAGPIRFTGSGRPQPFLNATAPTLSGLFIYFINRPAAHFPCLLFQTRYGTNCFARRAGEAPAGGVFITSTHSLHLYSSWRTTNAVTRGRILRPAFPYLGRRGVPAPTSVPPPPPPPDYTP